jgi:hypothetical protein
MGTRKISKLQATSNNMFICNRGRREFERSNKCDVSNLDCLIIFTSGLELPFCCWYARRLTGSVGLHRPKCARVWRQFVSPTDGLPAGVTRSMQIGGVGAEAPGLRFAQSVG